VKVQPQAFLAIERTMIAAMQSQWDGLARDIVAKLQPLLSAGKWGEAQEAVNRIDLNGVVRSVEGRIEELCVSALIFGAHHVKGSVHDTAYAKGKPIPLAVKVAVNQLVHMVEADGRDFLCNYLHEQIEAAKRDDPRQHMQKDDVSVEQLEETGGLQEPEQGQRLKRKRQKLTKKDGKKTLYVHRPLLNAWEVIAWADAQGFKNVQRPEDMHVTICYSKTPFDWTDLGPKMDNVTVVGGSRGVQQFGDALVLRFDSDILAEDHQELIDAGASYDFDEYNPHITLTWEKQPKKMLAELSMFEGNLQFGPEEFAPINADWKEDHDEIVLRKADQALADMLNDAVLKGKKLPIATAASLTTSRLISLGFLQQAADDGVTQYQVTEVLDDRTCPVCQFMHGKIFSVAGQHSRALQALGTDDPADLKVIAPWPGQSGGDLAALKDLTLDEMQDAGYGSPPYHPGCRGFLVMAGSAPALPALDEDALLAEAAAAEAVEAAPAEIWTPDAIEELQWKHLQITDPDVFKAANDAFLAGDYDLADAITEDFFSGHAPGVVAKEDPFDPEGPYARKKRRRDQQPGGLQQDDRDLTNDGSSTDRVMDAVDAMNDYNAPLDRV
jgi:hypothetical protein